MFGDPLSIRKPLIGQVLTVDGRPAEIMAITSRLVVFRDVLSGHCFESLIVNHLDQLRSLLPPNAAVCTTPTNC